MLRIEIVDYDFRWPETFQRHAATIAQVLGRTALRVEHVGSTSVTGLGAKSIVDILLVVPNSGDESAYVPRLESAGYVLRIREPDFHEHRMFRTPEGDVHVHVFSLDSADVGRMLKFRDRLRGNATDRGIYEEAKRRLAAHLWPDMDAYARAKADIVERIMAATD